MTKQLDLAKAKTVIDRIQERFQPLWDVLETREKFYYQDPSVDPPMLEGYESHAWQSSILRDTWTKFRSRLVENEFQPQIHAPRPSAVLDKKASDAELALTSMFSDLRTRTGDHIQGLLADGMGIYNYGVLHAYLSDEDMNKASGEMDYEETDEPEEESRFTEDEYAEDSGKTKAKKYRETEQSWAQRRGHARAMAKPAWKVKVYHPRQCGFVEQESSVGEFKYFLTVEEIALIDWFGEEIEREDIDERPTSGDVSEGGTVSTWRPSQAGWEERRVKLYRLWCADYLYEVVDGLENAEAGFKAIPNRCKAVPFWLAPGMVTLNNDPILKYEPLLTSLYRIKPIWDRYLANMSVLAESAAIPRYWCVPMGDQILPPLTDESGHVRIFGANAMESFTPPEGYRWERIGGDGTTGQYERLREVLAQEVQSAVPDTGVGDLKDSTQPWTARIIQQVGNIVPGMAMDHLEYALLGMIRMMIRVNGDEEGPGDIAFYPQSEGSKADNLIVLSPKDWQGLWAEVSIDHTSAVERTTTMQYGAELVAAGRWTEVDWIEKAEGEPDPQRTFIQRQAFMYWQQNVLPLQLKAGAAKAMGSKYSMQPVSKPGDTPFVNGAGVGAMPQEVLQAGQPVQPQGQAMGGMPSLNAPGTAPVGGLVG